MPPPGKIRVEDRGFVRVLTVDNPGKRNAFDYGSLAELDGILEKIGA